MYNKHYLVFDISNMLYRTFYANKKHDEETAAGLAHHTALMTLNKYFKKFKPDKVVMAFDRSSWRKDYTASDLCVSGKPYKGNRRQKMTPSEKEKFARFLTHLKEFEDMMREHTSVVCIAAEKCEADDIIAMFVRKYEDDKITVVTADKDMIQLLDHPNIELLDPSSGKRRSLEEWGGDAGFFLFEKCFRGDQSDNVQNAFPGVRKTRLKKAYNDDYELNNILNEKWTAPDGTKFKVKELYNENKLLMDLRAQPNAIKQRALDAISEQMENPGTYSYFHFLQFCGKFELKEISKNAETFSKMLSR